MSQTLTNLIAIHGTREEVLKFFSEGLDAPFDDLYCGKEPELEGLTLRSWIPGTDEHNIEELDTKYNSSFDWWECQEDDEDVTIVVGSFESTPGIPYKWAQQLDEKYPKLDFYLFSSSEECTEYSKVSQHWEVTERIRPALYPTKEDDEFYYEEVDKLRDRFFAFTSN